MKRGSALASNSDHHHKAISARASAVQRWAISAVALLSSIFFWTGAEAQAQDGYETLETRLAGESGQERLSLLVQLMMNSMETDQSRVLVYGTEALTLVEKFPDSARELKILNALCFAAYRREEHETAVNYGKRAEELARRMGESSELAFALTHVGNASRRLGEHQQALESSLEASRLYESLGNRTGLGTALNGVGYAYWRMGDYSKAMQSYFRAREAFETAGNRKGEGKSQRNIGILHLDMGQAEKALEFFEQALEIQQEENNDREIGKLWTEIGKAHIMQGEPDQALEYLLSSLKIKEEISDKTGIAVVLGLIGQAYAGTNNLSLALDYHQQALRLRRDIGDRMRQASSLVNIASIQRKQGNHGLAIQTFREGLAIASETRARPAIQAAFHGLSQAYSSLGRYRKALEAFQQYEKVKSEIFNEQSSRLMAEIQFRHHADQQQEEIETLRHQQTLDTLELDRQYAIRTALMICLALLALVIAIKTRASRQIAIRNEQLSKALNQLEESEARHRRLAEERAHAKQQAAHGVEVEAKNVALATKNAELPGFATAPGFTTVPATVPACFCLRWHHEGLKEHCSLLSPGENQIGRARDCDVVIPIEGISRRHARLTLDAERLTLEDLGSRHGTWVNHQRVESVDLHPGDTLQFASVKVRLEQIDVQDTELGLALDDPSRAPGDEPLESAGDDLTSTSISAPSEMTPYELVFPKGHLPGDAASMHEMYQAMHSLLRTELTVLIEGETGVGKECIARILHMSSCRREGPFVAVNCAAIPAELLEAEMFGIGHGVATGVNRRSGRFRAAHGGTLFLDEVGEMALELQAKLLRAVQEKKIQPVGGDEISADVWIVAATNQDLLSLKEVGKFRADLYYRLAGSVLKVPPLRDRRDDLAPLIEHFLSQAVTAEGKRVRGLTVKALDLLRAYDWPGNVRELEHEVKRMAGLAENGQMIDSAMLSERILGRGRAAAGGPPSTRLAVVNPAAPASVHQEPETVDETLSWRLKDHVNDAERQLILMALTQVDRSRNKAASLLGISRSTLARKISDLGISA